MKFDKTVNHVEVERDCFGEHFSSEVKYKYIINVNGEACFEEQTPKELAVQLKNTANQLLKWSKYFAKTKNV